MAMENKSFAARLATGVGRKLGKLSRNPYGEVNLNWFSLKYYKHLSGGKLRVHRLFGKKFHFNAPAELLHGLKEIFIDEIYKQTLTGRPYIIDCGANIGLSVIYMKRLYPEAEILAYEPDEENFKLLMMNMGSFGYQHVDCRKEAVWKEDTVLQFSNEGSMSSKIEMTGGGNTRDVRAVRLKNLLSRKVDFLKIDIEGAEYEVLRDAADSLGQVSHLFIEYHGNFDDSNQLTEIFEILTKNRFAYYIKEATTSYPTPFYRDHRGTRYDIQLNIFCFRN
jgi:FkbM family methyltransferase